jgi:hypothetical protein
MSTGRFRDQFTPIPGRSGTSIIALRTGTPSKPSVISYQNGSNRAGYSNAIKLSGRVAQTWISEAEDAICCAVGEHHDAVQVRVLGNPLQLCDAAHVARIGAFTACGWSLMRIRTAARRGARRVV